MINGLCKIAEKVGNCRLAVSYSGENRYVIGICDGLSTPESINGTISELEAALPAKLAEYSALVEKEAAERKAKEEEIKRAAEIKAAEEKLKKEEADRKAAQKKVAEENKAAQGEFNLF